MNTYTIDIRDRRQATFPSDLLDRLGINIGDSVEITVNKNLAILKPKKQIAMEAILEIQKAFKNIGISEKQFLKELDDQRRIDTDA